MDCVMGDLREMRPSGDEAQYGEVAVDETDAESRWKREENCQRKEDEEQDNDGN